jgi:hypothetical protein
VGVWALAGFDDDAAYCLPIGRHEIHSRGFVACVDEGRAPAGPVEQFERAAPQNERLGLIGTLGRFVDNAHANSIACEFGRQCHSDRARTDDQHLGRHAFYLFPKSGYGGT